MRYTEPAAVVEYWETLRANIARELGVDPKALHPDKRRRAAARV